MELSQAKKTLTEMQSNLQTRIDKITQDFMKGRSADFAEQATETENDEVLQNIKAEAELELRHVNSALSRIAQGSYGECEHCGESISTARLDALPYATECIDCASRH